MNCSSEPGVIAAGAGALPGARRRYEAGTRTYGRAMRTCLALLAATALLAMAAPAQAQTEVWSATLTPVNIGGSGILGCLDVPFAQCSITAILSDDDFTHDSTDYTVFGLILETDGSFSFAVDTIITTETAALTLVVGSTSLVLADATTTNNLDRTWASSGVSLTAGTAITVKLTAAAPTNTPATGAPTITGTAQVGQTLTASTTGIADADGLTSVSYAYQWIRVNGTEADIAAANSSTYILVDADLGTTLKVRVTFADDASNSETLTSAATATVGAAATGPPTVTDVAVTSTPASGTTYYLAGEAIEFTVTFSAPVTVTATPKFAFRLGAATRQAAYASGSDSAALVFARTVQAGEVDSNGISWNALALALDGGTITQTGATTAARLTHAAQASLEGHRVDAAPPMQVSAAVRGLSLVLVYDEPLDPASMPATGAYTVTATVGATTTNPAVSEVSIYGIWVTLALDAAPAAGATVTLAYAPPASNPVQDEAGNDAPAFSGQSVRLGPPPPDLEQVLGVSVTPGNAQLVVTWTAVSTATGYTVQWKSGGQGYNTGDRQATVTSGTTTSHTITGLANGTEYTVQVSATRTGANDTTDDGPPSDEMTGTPFTTPPPPPPVTDLEQVLGVSVTPGNAQLVVTWTAVDTATGYTVQWKSGGQGYNTGDRQATVTSGSTTSHTITGLANGTEYTVQVSATRTGANDGPPSDEMTGTPFTTPPPPPPVTDLEQVLGVSVTPGNAQLVVTWTAVDTATGYTVQWTSSGQGYNTGDRQATVTSGSTTSHTITGLANGTEYTVRVIATRTSANDGPPSSEVTASPVTTPGAPQHLSAVPGYEQVTLTWDAPSSDGGSAILRYEVAVDDSGTWIDAGLDLEETVTGLTNGQRYAFAVRAVNAAGTGPAATVTIVTSNPLPQAWLARFGRAATDHVVDAVSSRWQGGPQASHLTIGGVQTGALFGWIERVGQAARDTADDRGDPVRTEASWAQLFAPSGGSGTGGGGTGPGMTVTDRNTGPVGLGGVDRKAGAPLSGRAAQGALLGALGLPDPRALTDLRAALLGRAGVGVRSFTPARGTKMDSPGRRAGSGSGRRGAAVRPAGSAAPTAGCRSMARSSRRCSDSTAVGSGGSPGSWSRTAEARAPTRIPLPPAGRSPAH